MTERTIKVVIAIVLGICLFDMPYGFYQLARFVAMIGFGLLAFRANEQKQQGATIIYISLAILFQPLLKISLGRELWNIIDVVVAIGLLVTLPKK